MRLADGYPLSPPDSIIFGDNPESGVTLNLDRPILPASAHLIQRDCRYDSATYSVHYAH